MMKLTEEYIKENSQWPPEITQQILDDYEKARKWDFYYWIIEKINAEFVNAEVYFKQVNENQKLREQIEKRIEIHKETYDKLKNVLSPDDKGSMFKACQEDMLNELQKLLEDIKK